MTSCVSDCTVLAFGSTVLHHFTGQYYCIVLGKSGSIARIWCFDRLCLMDTYLKFSCFPRCPPEEEGTYVSNSPYTFAFCCGEAQSFSFASRKKVEETPFGEAEYQE